MIPSRWFIRAPASFARSEVTVGVDADARLDGRVHRGLFALCAIWLEHARPTVREDRSISQAPDGGRIMLLDDDVITFGFSNSFTTKLDGEGTPSVPSAAADHRALFVRGDAL